VVVDGKESQKYYDRIASEIIFDSADSYHYIGYDKVGAFYIVEENL